jgi:hypothetical protein
VAKKTSRDFTLEDARRLSVIRAFTLVIEKKSTELAGTDKDGKRFQAIVREFRELLRRLDEMTKECGYDKKKQARGDDCCDGYEMCGDGICRVWCS